MRASELNRIDDDLGRDKDETCGLWDARCESASNDYPRCELAIDRVNEQIAWLRATKTFLVFSTQSQQIKESDNKVWL